ncbi:MAG: hypothetical protein ABI837_13190 [Acidobacteriota bacterium]
MKEHKVRVVVMADGRVVVEGVPVVAGQSVEVIIRIDELPRPQYPLRGLPIRYDRPFEPAILDEEWDSSK